MSDEVLRIDYYSDVLCVWAWIAQRRIDELNQQFGKRIEWHHHYADVFGDVAGKMQAQWSERGGYDAFAQHVAESVRDFEHAEVNPKIWHKVRPSSSANAHLFLKAVELAHGADAEQKFALCVRRAFFVEARDISDFAVLGTLLGEQQLDADAVIKHIHTGTATAQLMANYQQCRQLGIKGSPSYVMNNGRQTLYGNVGYRVLHANIEELLKHPIEEASWC